MDYRKKLFSLKNIYDMEYSDPVFLDAIKESIDFHRVSCPDYDKILTNKGFKTGYLKSVADLHLIPPIPTMFYKSYELFSVPENKMLIKSTTSGTKGIPTTVGLDMKTCVYGARMIWKTIAYHKLFSAIPTNYIVLGYQPNRHNKMGAVKTAFGSTFLAPPLRREYALKSNGAAYDLNIEGIKTSLFAYSKAAFPVRFVGFPAYLYFMMTMLKENNIRLSLHPKSKILLGGGWKQFHSDQVSKLEMYQMAEETLGINEQNIKEFFAVVESNVLFCDCINHHFHVPVYGRVIIRDVKTLEPVPNGMPGILNLISPITGSMPLGSILTDDLAIMYDGKNCGCGIQSPYFEILGRVGIQEIKTCAAGASELLKKGGKL